MVGTSGRHGMIRTRRREMLRVVINPDSAPDFHNPFKVKAFAARRGRNVVVRFQDCGSYYFLMNTHTRTRHNIESIRYKTQTQ
jgi:hypothetical protein